MGMKTFTQCASRRNSAPSAALGPPVEGRSPVTFGFFGAFNAFVAFFRLVWEFYGGTLVHWQCDKIENCWFSPLVYAHYQDHLPSPWWHQWAMVSIYIRGDEGSSGEKPYIASTWMMALTGGRLNCVSIIIVEPTTLEWINGLQWFFW